MHRRRARWLAWLILVLAAAATPLSARAQALTPVAQSIARVEPSVESPRAPSSRPRVSTAAVPPRRIVAPAARYLLHRRWLR